jgi:hypothetical protein
MKYVEQMYRLRFIKSTKNLELKNIGNFKKKSKNMYNTTRNLGLEKKQGKRKKKVLKKQKEGSKGPWPSLGAQRSIGHYQHPLWVQHPNIMLISFYVVM